MNVKRTSENNSFSSNQHNRSISKGKVQPAPNKNLPNQQEAIS